MRWHNWSGSKVFQERRIHPVTGELAWSLFCTTCGLEIFPTRWFMAGKEDFDGRWWCKGLGRFVLIPEEGSAVIREWGKGGNYTFRVRHAELSMKWPKWRAVAAIPVCAGRSIQKRLRLGGVRT